MSRIHEAIRKAAIEQKYSGSAEMTSVDEILSMSYAVANREPVGERNGHATGPQISGEAVLPPCRNVDWAPDERKMLFASPMPDLVGREQFRSLRTNLYQIRDQRGLKVIGIASALSGEGKSFVAANLGHALALQGEHKVLLIDGDLRRGSLAGLIGATPGPGLGDYLRSKDAPESAIQHGSGGNLYLLPSGTPMQEPGELISGPGLKELIARLRKAFDWIVIDTPPALQFADAGAIADLCDGVLIVFGAGVTPRTLAKRAAQELNKCSMLVAVLNRAEDTERRAKYYSYYKRG
jgi:capsular exopolysaccharide synthesis family protein